jgi:hypothetical protein
MRWASASLVGCLTCRSRLPSAIRAAQTPYGAQAGQWRRNASALVLQCPMAEYKSRNERRERSVLRGAMAKENAMANADNGPDSIVLRHLRNLDQKLDLVTERIEVLTERVGVLEGTFKILIEPMMTLHKRLDRVDQRLDRMERRLGPIEPPTPS